MIVVVIPSSFRQLSNPSAIPGEVLHLPKTIHAFVLAQRRYRDSNRPASGDSPRNVATLMLEFSRIKLPTLIAWGDQDLFCSRKDQDVLTTTIKEAKLLIYSGTGHAPHWEGAETICGRFNNLCRKAYALSNQTKYWLALTSNFCGEDQSHWI